MAETIPLTGPAILASGITVALALLAMLAAKLQVTQILGPVNAVGVLIALAASLTLLPAILALLGRRAFWPVQHRVAYMPSAGRETILARPIDAPRTKEYLRREGRWTRVGRAVILRPRRVLVGCVAALALCCAGVAVYDGMTNPVDLLHSSQESVRGYEVLADSFPAGVLAPTTIMLERRDRPIGPADLGVARAAIRGVGGRRRSRTPASARATGAWRRSACSSPTTRTGTPRSPASSASAPRWTASTGPGSSRGSATRPRSRSTTATARRRDNKVVIPLALLVIALVLTVLLRAIVAPLFLIATVVLSFAATMGISLVFFKVVFGHDAIDPAVPTFAFIFLVALGVDYNIFLMSRVREEALRRGTREGLSHALGATGPVITSAGIVLAGTFSVLMTIPVVPLLQIGFAVALGVVIDTFVVRTLLVPAITSLLGERTWWPSRARPDDGGRVAPIVSGVYRRPGSLHDEWRAGEPSDHVPAGTRRTPMTPEPPPDLARTIAQYRDHVSEGTAALAELMATHAEVRSEGTRIWDEEGSEYLDCGGYGVFILGHRHPRVVAAVHEQLDRHPMSSRVLLNGDMAQAAEELAPVAPAGLEYVFFTNSGAEATELAIKLARVNGRRRLISTHGGFHGKTNGALTVTGKPMFRDPFAPLLADVSFVAYDDVDALDAELGAGEPAAVVLEPVQAEGGVIVPADGYLRRFASCATATARCSSWTRSRPGWAGWGAGGAPTARASSPTCCSPARASAAASSPWPRSSPRPASTARSARTRFCTPPPTRATRSRWRPRGRRSRRSPRRTSSPARRRSARACWRSSSRCAASTRRRS